MRKAISLFVFALGLAIGITVSVMGEDRLVPAMGLTQTAADARYVNKAGDTMTGSHVYTSAVLTAADATKAAHVVTRSFGDGRYVDVTGDTMSGDLVVPNATQGQHALNRATADGRYVFVVGDTMTGDLVVPNASADGHAVNRITADGRFVNASGDTTMTGNHSYVNAILAAADAAKGTHVITRDFGDARYVQTRSPITIAFGGGENTPYFTTTNSSYTTVAVFHFGGTTALGTPSKIKAIGYKTASPTSWDFQVLDITNATTIVEKTGNTGTAAEIVDAGATSNWPAGEAILELQEKRAGGSPANAVYFHSLTIEF